MMILNRMKWLVASGLLTLPILVLASNGGRSSGPEGEGRSSGDIALEGPITTDNVVEILDKIINLLLTIAAPIAVIMAIWAGFLYMTAGDKPEKVKTAHHTLLYVVVGVAVLILSKGIVSLVLSILK